VSRVRQSRTVPFPLPPPPFFSFFRTSRNAKAFQKKNVPSDIYSRWRSTCRCRAQPSSLPPFLFFFLSPCQPRGRDEVFDIGLNSAFPSPSFFSFSAPDPGQTTGRPSDAWRVVEERPLPPSPLLFFHPTITSDKDAGTDYDAGLPLFPSSFLPASPRSGARKNPLTGRPPAATGPFLLFFSFSFPDSCAKTEIGRR